MKKEMEFIRKNRNEIINIGKNKCWKKGEEIKKETNKEIRNGKKV